MRVSEEFDKVETRKLALPSGEKNLMLDMLIIIS
jgi:hypothetical protein